MMSSARAYPVAFKNLKFHICVCEYYEQLHY
jgi:hypothetical protein